MAPFSSGGPLSQRTAWVLLLGFGLSVLLGWLAGLLRVPPKQG